MTCQGIIMLTLSQPKTGKHPYPYILQNQMNFYSHMLFKIWQTLPATYCTKLTDKSQSSAVQIGEIFSCHMLPKLDRVSGLFTAQSWTEFSDLFLSKIRTAILSFCCLEQSSDPPILLLRQDNITSLFVDQICVEALFFLVE